MRGSPAGRGRCGPVLVVRRTRAFLGGRLREVERRGRRLADGIAEHARGSLRGRGARLSAAAKTYCIQCSRFGAAAANPPVVVDKSEGGGIDWAHLAILLSPPLPSPPPLHPEPRAKSERRKKKRRECTLAIV